MDTLITETPYALNMRDVYLQAIEELAKPYPSVPLNDWPTFTKMTGGFRTREFSILCGATGSGKTTFLANLSAQLLKQQVKHFVMSVETGHTDFMKRIISVYAGEDVNTGEPVSADKLARIHTQNAKYLESDCIEFSLYEDRVSVDQLLADLRYMVEVKKCKIAMIDNLNFFLEVKKSSDSILEMDRVIHELIIFCKQADVHVIMVMHPRKGGDSRDTRILSEFEIKGSSTAVQEAHNVFLFNRPSQEALDAETRHWTDRELLLRKMRRRGMYSGTTILLKNNSTRYSEAGYE